MHRKIIAIIDLKAEDIVGPLWLFRHDAVALRQFIDIAEQKDTQVHQHLEDYELVELGQLEEDNQTITPTNRVITTGKALKALMEQEAEKAKAAEGGR